VASESAGTEAAADPEALGETKVLLVEDEPMAREATARLLEQSGAQVRAVSSAERAREAFVADRPDVVVADIGMPEEDGYALMKSLRALEQQHSLTRTPALAVTAFARTEDRQRALEVGFDEHLTKPVEPNQLVCVLTLLIRRRDERGQDAP
jgi:CheY-like chemotaxis protein